METGEGEGFEIHETQEYSLVIAEFMISTLITILYKNCPCSINVKTPVRVAQSPFPYYLDLTMEIDQ